MSDAVEKTAAGATARDQIGVASFFIWKHLFKLANRQLSDLLGLFGTGHDGSPYRQGIVSHV